MESMESVIGQLLKKNNVESQLKQMKQSLLEEDEIALFLQKTPNITSGIIDRSLSKLFEFKTEIQHCTHCPGLKNCPNMMKGYQPQLFLDGNRISLSYSPCTQKRKKDIEKEQQTLIKSLYIPKEVLHANFERIETSTSTRLEAIQEAFRFATSIQPGTDVQGLYLHGKFGVGKTYIMGAVANELADRQIETFFVYTPDFFREMKQGISDGSYHQKLDRVKTAQVLILDDIGAESMSSWIRDEVLGVILQYRMLEKLPTLYTSNYDLEELEQHLSYTEKNGLEELKAKRIMERIRHYTTAIFIDGENKRR